MIKKQSNNSTQSKTQIGSPRFPAPLLPRSLSPLFLLILLLATTCQADLLTPPRLATATAQAQATPTATAEPLIITAPDSTAVPTLAPDAIRADPNPSLTVWINETSPAHEAALSVMAQEFNETYQIDVELIQVSPILLPDLMATAVLSDTLPDLVLHPVEYTLGWTRRGILDPDAAAAVLDQLGQDTFNPAALELATVGGQTAALPSDGYPQIILYRTDWAAEFDLAPPDSYDAMLTMAQTISNTERLISGFVIPTESNLVTTHQAFEHIAAGNGCRLIDDKGEVEILDPACQEAIDFYYNIVHNYSPIGVQTDTSATNAYLAGRTGLIMTSPEILPALAGLDPEAQPSCPNCDADPAFLAQNSGILTNIEGRSANAQPVSFGNLTYLGITTAAERETAVTFARYWFNEGYANWLAVESERKVPLRWGTADEPRHFIDAWGTQPLTAGGPSLTDLYGETAVANMKISVAATDRWGFTQNQGQLVTLLYEELVFSVVLQEMLSGYFNSSQTLGEAYVRIIDLIPNYAYDRIDPLATPEE